MTLESQASQIELEEYSSQQPQAQAGGSDVSNFKLSLVLQVFGLDLYSSLT